MSINNELTRLDAVTLSQRIRSGAVAPTDVVQAIIDLAESIEPRLHAFCTPVFENALAQARQVEKDIADNKPLGPLAGVPMGIKDLVATKDIKTVCGSAIYENFLPEEDDVVVERLKAAGAVILGKTNVPEFGYSGVGHNPVFETTRNPWNLDMTPGGSSSGSGAAVAAGLGPLAIGSDGGGSIRMPAAHCGIYGFKPSMGRVPAYPGCRDERYPGISSWESLEHIGPMSRTVADSALMMSVIAGPDPRDRHSLPSASFDWMDAIDGDVQGLKIAYSEDWGYAAVDPEVRDIVRSAANIFESDLGCTVEAADPGWADPADAFWGLVALETDLEGMRKLLSDYAHQMTPHLVDFLRKPWTAEELTNAVRERKSLNNKMWRFMQHYDLLLTPTLTVPPFPVHTQGPEKVEGRIVSPTQWLSFTYPINMTGQPAASIPAGWTRSGLPVGLQIVGRHLDDPTVLKASRAFETAAPWHERWPSPPA